LIEAHLANYAEIPTDLGGVAGRVEQPEGDLPPENITVFGRYHRWSGTMIARFNASHRADVEIAPGGNMSFEREILLGLGGFDPGFEGNGYFFETDGSLRVVEAGFRIVFDPRAQVKHLMAPRGGARVTSKAEHTYSYVKNGIRLYRKHSPAAGLPLFILKQGAYVLAKSAYNFDPRIAGRGLAAIKNALIEG
jgi:GT2 family glycosyltransferase